MQYIIQHIQIKIMNGQMKIFTRKILSNEYSYISFLGNRRGIMQIRELFL